MSNLLLLGSGRTGFGSASTGFGAQDEYDAYVTVPPPLDPLRELPFDDADFSFWTYQNWTTLTNLDWPGGVRNRSLTYCDAVHDGDVSQAVTRRFYTTGTQEEGIELYFANEGSGPLDILLDGNLLATVYGQSVYSAIQQPEATQDLRRYYGNPYGNTNAPFRDPTVFTRGWHVITLVKKVNAAPGDYGSGDRRTYFDGGKVYTRDRTFS